MTQTIRLQGEDAMPKVELTYQQVLEVVKQLTPQEQEQLEADLRASPPFLEYHVFTAHDPLWKVVGAGKGTGKPALHRKSRLHKKQGFCTKSRVIYAMGNSNSSIGISI